MPQVLKVIEDLASNIAPAYTTAHIVPRGVPRFVDQALKGTLKYSRRIGNVLPTIQPQNQISLTEDATILQNQLRVNAVLPGFEPKSLIQINSQEILEIADADGSLGIISLTEDLLVSHAAGSSVDLFAVPVYIYGPVAPGGTLPTTTTNMLVRSSKQIITGDQLYIQQTADLILSGTDYTVTEAALVGMVANDFIINLTLDHPIPRELEFNATVYLRAFPGYVSPKVRIPMHRKRPMYLGPFVVDYVSGRFDDGDEITEALDIQAYSAADLALFGTVPPGGGSQYFVRAYKNFPVLDVPIHASSFLFWDVVRGKINYQADQFILETDSEGRAVISTELTPGWPAGHTWICQAQGLTATSGSIYYRFFPNDQQTAGVVTQASPSTLEFTLTGQTATRMEITLVGPPNSSVKWNSWLPVSRLAGPPVSYRDNAIETLQYTLAARVTGSNIWQAGSLMIKPYFNVVADIEGFADMDSFNNGAVMF